MNRKLWKSGRLWVGCGLPLFAGTAAVAEPSVNRYVPHVQVADRAEGISWPKGQALPTFATPAATLDAIPVRDLSKDEQITFSALQGLVNRKQPRIFFLDPRAEEGPDTWAKTAGLEKQNRYSRDNKLDLVAKYANEVAGVVLYDPAISPHYRNLASTAASVAKALPMTAAIHAELEKKGVRLRVIEDLTQMKESTPLAIYQYLFDHYWGKCGKRLIFSAKPHDQGGGGDYHHTRDLAAATGSAVVWLDTIDPVEKAMLGKFFGDMKAGEALALGWYKSERSGITTASAYGLGTLPADFYMNGTVYSGTAHRIRIPAVPKMPVLENKVYVALMISDGDNIQYTQHALRKNWDRTVGLRGKMALNWTISPALVDVGPALLNYYYTTATPNDCFISGPSGLGYLMPFNTLTEPGAPIGEYLKDPAKMDGYTRFTETYLQRSGLRAVTIWDDATPMQRQSYEKNCRSLYGITVQNFKDVPAVAAGVENKRLRFDKLVIPYAGSYEHINRSMLGEINRWDRKAPHFLSYQVDIWGELKPERVIQFHDDMLQRFPGKIEFVRADHYFNLYNQANGLPFNLALAATTKVKASDAAVEPERVLDGTPETVWSSSKPGKQWLGFEFDSVHQISRCVIHHAADHGDKPFAKTADFAVQTSLDGKDWKTAAVFKNNKEAVTDVDFPPAAAKYLRLLIDRPGTGSNAAIAEVEIYGARP